MRTRALLFIILSLMTLGCKDEPGEALIPAPVFEDQSFGVVENSPNGTVIGQLVASFQGSQELRYGLMDPPNDFPFVLSPAGELSVGDSTLLDHENQGQWVFEVQLEVVDLPNLNQKASITVNVGDVLDIPPDFQDQVFQIAENSANGTIVGQLVATFADSIPTNYALFDPDPNLPFALSSTGELSVRDASALDFESQVEFEFEVVLEVPQQTNLNQQATIQVRLTDLLEIPIDFQDQAFQVAEDAPNLRFIGSLTITFPDSIPVSYSFVNPPSNLPFSLDSDGDLLVRNPENLDYESQSVYELEVNVEADNYPEANAQARVTIDVENVSEGLLLFNYKFEGNGQNESTFGNDLSFSNEGIAFVNAYQQQGLSLSGGKGELLDVRIFDGLDSFTMGGWIQPTQISGRNRVIIAKTSPDRDLVLMINSDGRLNAHFTDRSGFVHRFSVATISTNQWTHVAATWDGSAWKLYINGQFTASTGTDPQGRKPLWVSKEMAIGSLSNGGDPFIGILDEIRFYDYALTDGEIAQWHNE